jgi:integration host factor subunit beta
MTKSELIIRLSKKFSRLDQKDIDIAVRNIFEEMVKSLSSKKRIEIRGFGSFSLNLRKARMGRNPKTGAQVLISQKYVPHFKPGKELKVRVDK